MGMTDAERREVAEAVVAGRIGKGDTVECLGGLFTVGAVERRQDDIHVVMLARPMMESVEIAFRVGGDSPDG